MNDYIVRAMAADNQIRAFAATSKNLVELARQTHNTSPVATAALGRLLTGSAMMGVMMKNEDDLLTVMMRGDGPINGVTVTADSHGNVKGYVGNPEIVIPPNYLGKLDVGGAIGYGTLTVMKDLGLKEPYVSQVALTTSEVAEDLMEKNNTVKQAGGFIIQLMPFAEERVVDILEKKIATITSVTDLLEQGMTPEDILKFVLSDFGEVEFTDKIETQFKCNCSKERVTKALISLGKKELQSMIDDGEEIELNCHFCNSHYKFSVDEMKEILKNNK